MEKRISILGTGTWGTALGRMLANAGHQVTMWSALPAEIDQLSKNRRHVNLPGVEIPDSIRFTDDLSEACTEQDIVVFAVPSVFVRETAAKAAAFIPNGQIIVDVAKGIEPITFMTMSEIIRAEINRDGKHRDIKVVALSGPTHAEEVARDMMTTIVSACSDYVTACEVQRVFTTSSMRVYTNTDVLGVEICGAFKNIIALATGISHGIGCGDNARAALVTRGIVELSALGRAIGCLDQTFNGLAGVGDLIVTATSEHSRNNRAGYLMGQGMLPAEAIAEVGMVVEGINALPAAIGLIQKYNVEMPIVEAVHAIVNKGMSPVEAMHELMCRKEKSELLDAVLDIQLEKVLHKKENDKKMKRVITYGTFDLLHYGHINLLRRAKALGDYLVVVVSTDEFNWNEKHKKCYFTYKQRKALVEAVRYVDLVVPEENWEQKRSDMHEYHIDTFVMGDDWVGKFDFLKEEGVEVVYLPRTPEISSTQIKNDLHK